MNTGEFSKGEIVWLYAWETALSTIEDIGPHAATEYADTCLRAFSFLHKEKGPQ